MNDRKILLIHHDQDTCQTLSQLLAQESYDITICQDGLSGFQSAMSEQYLLIMSDVVLPTLNGFELLKKLRPNVQTPILMYSSREDPFDSIYAFELGADDYVVKGANNRELIARINALIRRMHNVKSNTRTKNIVVNQISLSVSTREVCCHEQLLSLTSLEFDVLHYLILHAGSVISKADITIKVLKREASYYDRSIDMHISNIRKKIAKTTPDIKIKTVRGAGYIFLQGHNTDSPFSAS